MISKMIKTDSFDSISNALPPAAPFYAFVISSWHLDNLVASVLLRGMKGGVVFVCPQGNIKNDTRYRIKEENFRGCEGLFDTVYFLETPYMRIDLPSLARHLFRRKDHTLRLIVPSLSDRLSIRRVSAVSRFNARIEYIVIDEGLSSYLPYSRFVQYGNNAVLNRIASTALYALFVKPLITLMCRGRVYDDRLFRKERARLVCNEKMAGSLKTVYEQRVSRLEEADNQPCIVIYKDFGVTTADIDYHIYGLLFDALEDCGYMMYIKKHPNDNNSDFDAFVSRRPRARLVPAGRSGEELVPRYRPRLIIGGYTTVVFSAAHIFDINAVSFMRLYLDFAGVPAVVKRNIAFFSEMFAGSRRVAFPPHQAALRGEIRKALGAAG